MGILLTQPTQARAPPTAVTPPRADACTLTVRVYAHAIVAKCLLCAMCLGQSDSLYPHPTQEVRATTNPILQMGKLRPRKETASPR